MSADLFEAFVGTQPSRKDQQEPASNISSGLLIQTDSAKPEDTWQSWPAPHETSSESLPKQQSQTLWETDGDGKDVLFDAVSFDTAHIAPADDDDFGDFEQAVTERSNDYVSQVASRPTTVNLLDIHVDGIGSPEVVATESPSEVEGHPSRGVHVAGQFSQIVPKEEITTSADEQDDEWGNFETNEVPRITTDLSGQSEAPQKATVLTRRKKSSLVGAKLQEKTVASTPKLKSSSVENKSFGEEPWDNFDNEEPDKSHDSDKIAKPPPQQLTIEMVQRDRPSNVPPPAVLLAWLPKIFSALAAQAGQPDANTVAGIPALQAYRVSARIIAGRAARWKRDSILAQSMKIGAAGRSGGMKLTALDKGESRKEDQAAEEVTASWNRFSHVLNAAIIKAKAQKPPMALSSRLSARIATGLDVISAAHICAVCGLRRNERVVGIDVNVSDTFGEFWIEHWGHRDCADTWYGFNQLLDRR